MNTNDKYAAGYASIDWTNWNGQNKIPTIDLMVDYLHGDLPPLAPGQGPVLKTNRPTPDDDASIVMTERVTKPPRLH